jgi:putative membrane protein insertion efficiency factor
MMSGLHHVLHVPRRLLIGVVRAYRLLLKPWLGNACRFEPTCSAYAIEALERHGAIGGSALAGWRLLRCHPWCAGGCDPVPHNPPRALGPLLGLFTRLVPPDSPSPPAAGATPDGARTSRAPTDAARLHHEP